MNQTQLTTLEAPLIGMPHWSPDGQRIAFSRGAAEDSAAAQRWDDLLHESASYAMTPEQLCRLAGATVVRVRLRGGARSVDRELSPENVANLRRFAREYVRPCGDTVRDSSADAAARGAARHPRGGE